MNIRSSKSIWGHGGRFDGEEVSSPFFGGGGWGSSIPGCYETIVYLVAWPLNESKAGVDLVLIESSLLFLGIFLLISMRTASLT